MADIDYKPEGSVGHSLSSLASGLWNEISSVPSNVWNHYKENTGTALLETLCPPLLIVDAEVRAHEKNSNDTPLTPAANSMKNMIEDSILHGNTSQLKDLMVLHSGDPNALDRIMHDAQKDLEQYGVKLDYKVDDSGKGQLHLGTATHFMNTSSDGTQTFGDVRNGNEVAATNSTTADNALHSIAQDAQQYTQQRFRNQ